MKREIKFRGLTADEPYWIYGMPRAFNSGRVEIFDGYNGFYVIPETVGQFTGLHDKNGKEIYEGDNMSNPNGKIYEVHFHEASFFLVNGGWYRMCKDFMLNKEVVGNIYETQH